MDIETLLKAPDGSIRTIDVNNLLDSVPHNERVTTLVNVAKKIRYEGLLEIAGTDLGEVLRAYRQGYIELDKVNELILSGRQSVGTAESVIDQLKQLNFKIMNVRVNHYMYYIQAQRCLKS